MKNMVINKKTMLSRNLILSAASCLILGLAILGTSCASTSSVSSTVSTNSAAVTATSGSQTQVSTLPILAISGTVVSVEKVASTDSKDPRTQYSVKFQKDDNTTVNAIYYVMPDSVDGKAFPSGAPSGDNSQMQPSGTPPAMNGSIQPSGIPSGNMGRSQPTISLYSDTIKTGDYLTAQGSYDATSQTITIVNSGDYLKTFASKSAAQ